MLIYIFIDIILFIQYITNEGSNCVFRTNKDAPNYRLINIDLSKPEEPNWTVLVPVRRQKFTIE